MTWQPPPPPPPPPPRPPPPSSSSNNAIQRPPPPAFQPSHQQHHQHHQQQNQQPQAPRPPHGSSSLSNHVAPTAPGYQHQHHYQGAFPPPPGPHPPAVAPSYNNPQPHVNVSQGHMSPPPPLTMAAQATNPAPYSSLHPPSFHSSMPPQPPPPTAFSMPPPPPSTSTPRRPPPPPGTTNYGYSQPPPPPPLQQQQPQQPQQQGYGYPPNPMSRSQPPPAFPGPSTTSQYPQPPPTQPQPPTSHYPQPSLMDRGATTQKLDPARIPRPPLFTRPQDGQPTPIYYPRRAVDSQMTPDSIQAPPPADSRFLVVDDGNASPQLMRSTLYGIPMSKATLRKCGDVDMGLVCHPLALPSHDYTPRTRVLPDDSLHSWQDPQAIPVERSTSPDQPPRCSRCLAYVNPFWDIPNQKCNFCGASQKTASLGVEIQSLSFQVGTVEYVVGGPYVTRPTPVQPVILYALDLTCPRIQEYTSILEQVLWDISSHFHSQPAHSQPAPRAGIVLVSATGVHVPHPQGGFVCMPDVTEEPFCPLPLSEWTYDLATPRGIASMQMFMRDYCESALEALVAHTRQFKTCGKGESESGYSLSCGGAAMAFLVDALQHSGGRAVWISWRRPNHGVGSLRDRERLKDAYSAKNEGFMYSPLPNQPEARLKEHSGDEAAAQFYKALGEACAKHRIAMDIVIHSDPSVPRNFLDLATLGEVCRISNGRLIWVKSADWQETFREELLRSALGFSGWDAVFKVRCSTGLQVKSFLSNVGVFRDGGLTGSPELELSVVTPDTCIAVDLEHRIGGLPKESKYVYLQTALLYTTLFGERRCRVSTLALRTASMAADCFRSMDFGAVATLQMRQAASPLLSPIHDEAGDNSRIKSHHNLLERCAKILASYRLHTTAVNSPMGQLILPDKLQLLPLFAMGLIKGPLLRPSMPKRGSGARSAIPSPRGDERAFYLHQASTASPAYAMLMAYPNLFSIENLQDGAGEWQAPMTASQADGSPFSQHNEYVHFPPSIHPTIASLDDKGIYLLDTCFAIYLFVGREVPANKIKEIKQYLSDPAGCNLAISRLIWQMRTFCHVGGGSESTVRPSYPPVILIKQSDGQDSRLSQEFMRWMICDSNTHEKDFVDFICDIYRQIRSKVDAGQA